MNTKEARKSAVEQLRELAAIQAKYYPAAYCRVMSLSLEEIKAEYKNTSTHDVDELAVVYARREARKNGEW